MIQVPCASVSPPEDRRDGRSAGWVWGRTTQGARSIQRRPATSGGSRKSSLVPDAATPPHGAAGVGGGSGGVPTCGHTTTMVAPQGKAARQVTVRTPTLHRASRRMGRGLAGWRQGTRPLGVGRCQGGDGGRRHRQQRHLAVRPPASLHPAAPSPETEV